MPLPVLGGLWLLPPWDFSQPMRVTLWITTAIHLDTPRSKTDPAGPALISLFMSGVIVLMGGPGAVTQPTGLSFSAPESPSNSALQD
jgi:hypothetical protein